MAHAETIISNDDAGLENTNAVDKSNDDNELKVVTASFHPISTHTEPLNVRAVRRNKLSKGLKIGLATAGGIIGLGSISGLVAYAIKCDNATITNSPAKQPPTQHPQQNTPRILQLWFGACNKLYLQKPLKVPDSSSRKIQCTNLARTLPISDIFLHSPITQTVLARLRIRTAVQLFEEEPYSTDWYNMRVGTLLASYDLSSQDNFAKVILNMELLVNKVYKSLIEKEPARESVFKARLQCITAEIKQAELMSGHAQPLGCTFALQVGWCIRIPGVLNNTENILKIFDADGNSVHHDDTLRKHFQEKDGKWILELGNCTDFGLLDNIHTLILTKDELKFIHPKRIGDFVSLIKHCYHRPHFEMDLRRRGANKLIDQFSDRLWNMAANETKPVRSEVDGEEISVLESTVVSDKSKQGDWDNAIKQIAPLADIFAAVGRLEETL